MRIKLIIGLGALLVSCQSSPSLESSSPNQYLIAYNTYEPDSVAKDNWEIRVLDPQDSNLGSQNILQHTDVAWTYIAEGDLIYFISDRDTTYRNFFLYAMKSDGSEVKKLSDLRLEDSWMDLDPQSGQMLVSARPEPSVRYQLYWMDLNSGKVKPFIQDTLHRYQDPVFSPDGNQIAYVKRPHQLKEGEFPEVFLVNRDGSGEKQLTQFPSSDPAAKSYGYKAGALRWHPTENFISYASTRGDQTFIFGINPDGLQPWQISQSGKDEVYHDWSPDGQWFVFDQLQDTVTWQYHLVLMNWKTKESKILTDTLIKSQLAPVFLEKRN